MKNSKETDKLRGFEISAVVATGLLKYVFMDWLNLRAFYIGVACIFWTVYIYKRYRKNNQILQHWGFRKDNFKQTFLFITPFALKSFPELNPEKRKVLFCLQNSFSEWIYFNRVF